jgi:hypothetical protein
VGFYVVEMFNADDENEFDLEVEASGPAAARAQAEVECPGYRAGNATFNP